MGWNREPCCKGEPPGAEQSVAKANRSSLGTRHGPACSKADSSTYPEPARLPEGNSHSPRRWVQAQGKGLCSRPCSEDQSLARLTRAAQWSTRWSPGRTQMTCGPSAWSELLWGSQHLPPPHPISSARCLALAEGSPSPAPATGTGKAETGQGLLGDPHRAGPASETTRQAAAIP